MLLETPLMYSRKFIPEAYQNKIYSGTITGKGSAATLQDDFLANVWTPDNTLVHNVDKTFDCDDAGIIPLDSGEFPLIAGDTDLVCVSVFKVKEISGSTLFLTGSPGTTGFNNRYSIDYTTGLAGIVKDGVTQLSAVQSRIDDSNDPEVGDTVVSVLAWDRSVGIYGYFYSISKEVEIDDTSQGGVANAAFTPTSQTRISLADNIYCSLTFAFPSNGLPSTWREDMVELANNVVNLKG